MGRYSGYTVEALQTEIAEYEAAIKSATLGGQVRSVGGEGRRMDVTTVNCGDARVELRELRAELARRPGFEGLRRGGIAVEIGR